MKFISKPKVEYELPVTQDGETNRTDDDIVASVKYVRDKVQEEITTTCDDCGDIVEIDDNGKISASIISKSTLVNVKDLPTTDKSTIDIINQDADSLNNVNGTGLSLANHTHTLTELGLGNVLINRQVKAPDDDTVTGGNIMVFSTDNDGSSVKDGGVFVEASVPENAVFTDTTYDVVTNTVSGIMSTEQKEKLDNIDIDAQPFYFNSIEEMVSKDMTSFPYKYAYGIVGGIRYKWKSSNTTIGDIGKWRTVSDNLPDVINLKSFHIDNGTLVADIESTTNSVVTQDTIDVGNIRIVPRGLYSSTETYDFLDIVLYDESLYACLLNNVRDIAPSNIDTWKNISIKTSNNYEQYVYETELSDIEPMTYDAWAKSLCGTDGVTMTDVELNTFDELLITFNNYIDEEGETDDGHVVNFGKITGDSIYTIACNNGYTGTEEDWLENIGQFYSDGTRRPVVTATCNINGVSILKSGNINDIAQCHTSPTVVEKDIHIDNFTLMNGSIFTVNFVLGNTVKYIKIGINNPDDIEAEKTYYSVYNGNILLDAHRIKSNQMISFRYYNGNVYVTGGVPSAIIADDDLDILSQNPLSNKAFTSTVSNITKNKIPYLVDADGSKGLVSVDFSNSIKSTLINNITDYNNEVSNINTYKKSLANAITSKGVSTYFGNSFSKMAENIENIPRGVKYASGTFSGWTEIYGGQRVSENDGHTTTWVSFPTPLTFTPTILFTQARVTVKTGTSSTARCGFTELAYISNISGDHAKLGGWRSAMNSNDRWVCLKIVSCNNAGFNVDSYILSNSSSYLTAYPETQITGHFIAIG